MNLTWSERLNVLKDSLLAMSRTTRVYGEPYSRFEMAKHLWASKAWRIIGPGPLVKIGSQYLLTNSYYWRTLFGEWKSWQKWYVPSNGLSGKVVLDVGAGTGESALFFFHHGTSKVIAIEPNAEAVGFLRHNKDLNRWNMEIIEAPFSLNQLDFSFDFAKIDCEGGEILLVKVSKLPVCAIEVHTQEILEALLQAHPDLSVFPGQEKPWEVFHR